MRQADTEARADRIGRAAIDELLQIHADAGIDGLDLAAQQLMFCTCAIIAHVCGPQRLHEIIEVVQLIHPPVQ